MDQPLQELVAAAVSGDRDAQTQVLERLLPRIRAIARSLLRDPSDTDDAVQEVSMQVLGSLRRYDGRGQLDAWAARVAERHVLRYLDKKRRRWWRTKPAEREQLEDLSHLDEPTALPPLAEGLPRDLHEYLRELPELQRRALVLRYSLGHSLAEIGELMGVSVSTVRGRIRLGTEALRKAVRQDLSVGQLKGDQGS